jgi:hypothetical protein
MTLILENQCCIVERVINHRHPFLEEIMQPKIKVGLLAGGIGLVLNICISGLFGLCGPFVSLIAGALAGYFAAKQENAATKNDGAKAGAIAGAIAGGLIIIGQIISGLAALIFVQALGTGSLFGQVPPASAGAGTQAIYYLTGIATSTCIGLVGVVLAALAGAGAGYLGTPDQPRVIDSL